VKSHILILTDPPVAPGYLPRLRYLCDYLQEQGYTLRVITEQREPLHFAHTYPIATIPIYTGTSWDWLIKSMWSLLTNWKERSFAQAVEQAIKGEHYDLILCTTFSTFPLGSASRLAERLCLPLIVDIRDLDEQVDHSTYQYAHQQRWLYPFRGLYRSVQIRRRNKAISQAQLVTTVSPWHVDFLQPLNSNVHLIYNGFDPRQFYAEDIPTDTFRITYIGSLFPLHNPEPLYQAVKELDLPHVEIDFHTPQHKPISHTEIGDTIRRSSIMVVLTSRLAHGMMTTKFSEALGCEKPILCIPSDEGCLADAMRRTNAGLATDNVEAIKTFIRSCYTQWQQQGFTLQAVQHKELFNRQSIAQQYEDLLRHSAHL